MFRFTLRLKRNSVAILVHFTLEGFYVAMGGCVSFGGVCQ